MISRKGGIDMDLWIRSQDKEVLMKTNVLKCVEYDDKYIINGYGTYECDNYDLGIYNSKERALEVLDEIQGTIINNKITNLIIPNVKDIVGNEEAYKKNVFSKMVYEMPKE
jgi:hypothetical protein